MSLVREELAQWYINQAVATTEVGIMTNNILIIIELFSINASDVQPSVSFAPSLTRVNTIVLFTFSQI
jgi:hypothetical protein